MCERAYKCGEIRLELAQQAAFMPAAGLICAQGWVDVLLAGLLPWGQAPFTLRGKQVGAKICLGQGLYTSRARTNVLRTLMPAAGL